MEKALRFLGSEPRRVTKPEPLREASAAVLPGVGAFDDCLNALRTQELLDAAVAFIETGRPFLGICVGYQALFEKSDEFHSCAAGLGVFKGRVVRFSGRDGLKVPQIGWNQLSIKRPDCPLFHGVPEGSYAYFVHSFYPQPADRSMIAVETEYGDTFASAIWRDNVYATQFHPEKSQKVGLQILRNFIELA